VAARTTRAVANRREFGATGTLDSK